MNNVENQAKGEARTSEVPQAVLHPDRVAMRIAYEKAHNIKFENREIPGKYCLGKKTAEIELQELEAEALSFVTSKLDGDKEALGTE